VLDWGSPIDYQFHWDIQNVLGKYRKYFEFLGLLLLAVLIIWLLGRRLDWEQVKIAVQKSDWRLILLAGIVILVAYVWRALRWWVFLAPLVTTSFKEVWVATTVGFAAIFTIGRLGEVVRPLVLPMRDKRVRPAASFVTIMIERLYDFISVALIFAVNLLWFSPPHSSGPQLARIRIAGSAMVILLALAVGLLIWFRSRSASVIGWLDLKVPGQSRLSGRLKRALLSVLDQLATALGVLGHVRELVLTIGLSLLLWFSVAFANLLIFRAFGLPFGMSEALFVLGWSMVASAVPTPGGGAGAFHAATGAALVLLGVGIDKAAAVAIVLGLVDFAPAAFFGFFYFLRGDVSIGRLRSMMTVSNVEHAVEDEKVALAGSAKPLEAAVNE
jgi:glycosyltransferase 2 family protein